MEIRPGWVLSDNIFMIKRNEGKFRERNKARRSAFDFEVFRPDIVELMIEARARLAAVSGQKLYTAEDIPGLGKNYLREEFRLKGIDAYSFYIGYYALKGLKAKLEQDGPAEDLLSEKGDSERWEHERQTLLLEVGEDKSLSQLLDRLADSQRVIAQDVQRSKAKDDIRGQRIIPDYAEAHTSAEEDSFVRATWSETDRMLAEIEGLKRKLD